MSVYVDYQRFMEELSLVEPVNDTARKPVFLDVFSGLKAPLAKAFLWCQWEAVTPIDIEIDKDLDVSRPSVRRAIHAVLPQVVLIAGAMSCATKSRAREKQPGPPPLRSEDSPRGLPGIPERSQQRVDADNYSSDYLLALHTWVAQHGLGGLRENPLRSLHWWDPIELHVTQQSTWHDLDYDACVFGGARKKSQRFRRNIPELAALPAVRCGHIHDPREWSSPVEGGFATFAETEYTPSLVFTLAVACTAWAASRGYHVTQVPRLPPISLSGDHRPLLQFEPSELRQDLMDVMGFHLGLSPPGVDSQHGWWLVKFCRHGSTSRRMRSTSALATSPIGGPFRNGRTPSEPWRAVHPLRVSFSLHDGSMTKRTSLMHCLHCTGAR